MTAQVIDGTAYAAKMKEEIAAVAKELAEKGHQPHLLAVQVGENLASRSYIASQKKSCEEVGIRYTLDELPEETTQNDLIAHIEKVNRNPEVDGIILQMPLPDGIDQEEVMGHIAPEKDAEGMTLANLGRLFHTIEGPAPCTAVAAVELMKSTGADVRGKDVVIVGRSNIVGKPLGVMLVSMHATVTTCHTRTKDLKGRTLSADILFTAAGATQVKWSRYKRALKKAKADGGPKPELPDLKPLISADMIRPGTIVIDVGLNRVPKGFDENGDPLKNEKGKTAIRSVGDVDFEAARDVASFITPPRGGVGPVTTAVLLRNVVGAARRATS